MNAGAFGSEISNYFVEAKTMTLDGMYKLYQKEDVNHYVYNNINNVNSKSSNSYDRKQHVLQSFIEAESKTAAICYFAALLHLQQEELLKIFTIR